MFKLNLIPVYSLATVTQPAVASSTWDEPGVFPHRATTPTSDGSADQWAVLILSHSVTWSPCVRKTNPSCSRTLCTKAQTRICQRPPHVRSAAAWQNFPTCCNQSLRVPLQGEPFNPELSSSSSWVILEHSEERNWGPQTFCFNKVQSYVIHLWYSCSVIVILELFICSLYVLLCFIFNVIYFINRNYRLFLLLRIYEMIKF